MEKIKFDFVDYYLRKLPVDVNKLIYEYYDNFCCYCENEMSLCFCCEKYFCMIARCGNSLCALGTICTKNIFFEKVILHTFFKKILHFFVV